MKTDIVQASDALVNSDVERLEFEVNSTADFQALRQKWTERQRIPKLVASPETGDVLLSGPQVIREKLSGDESAGALQVCYVTLEPGPGAPAHHQPTEDELWFAVDGEWEWTVGAQTIQASKGAFAYIPRNTTHTFRNVGTTTATMFTLNTPAGHERGFRKAGELRKIPGADVRGMLKDYGIIFHPPEDKPA